MLQKANMLFMKDEICWSYFWKRSVYSEFFSLPQLGGRIYLWLSIFYLQSADVAIAQFLHHPDRPLLILAAFTEFQSITSSVFVNLLLSEVIIFLILFSKPFQDRFQDNWDNYKIEKEREKIIFTLNVINRKNDSYFNQDRFQDLTGGEIRKPFLVSLSILRPRAILISLILFFASPGSPMLECPQYCSFVHFDCN
mgnify:FL=1